jgi:hypothetical protein
MAGKSIWRIGRVGLPNEMVSGILRNPNYKGTLRYNATTQKLRSKVETNRKRNGFVVTLALSKSVYNAVQICQPWA